VLEAMAHGLPVVVSSARYCGIAALLRAGQDALVLEDPHDQAAMAFALLRVKQEPALETSLRAAGLAFAQDHQWAALAQRQSALYQQLAIQQL